MLPVSSLTVALAVRMPRTSPAALSSAPPELPGFMVASLIVTSSWPLSSPPSRVRCRALTMPTVTDPSRPSGFPMASTVGSERGFV
jgi:hypothetical protein